MPIKSIPPVKLSTLKLCASKRMPVGQFTLKDSVFPHERLRQQTAKKIRYKIGQLDLLVQDNQNKSSRIARSLDKTCGSDWIFRTEELSADQTESVIEWLSLKESTRKLRDKLTILDRLDAVV